MNPLLTDPLGPVEPSSEYCKLIIDEMLIDVLNELKQDAIEKIADQLRGQHDRNDPTEPAHVRDDATRGRPCDRLD